MTAAHAERLSLGRELTGATRTVWAKHDRKTDGWLPLWQHMEDSAGVAELLWDRWVPRSVKSLVAEGLPAGESDARLLVIWLSATHDIGKATPAFACQVDLLANAMREAGLHMEQRQQYGDDRRMAPHGLAGQLLIQEWLERRYGWTGRSAAQFAVIAGGHHGVPPGHEQIHDLDLHPELLRARGADEECWRQVQTELLDACARVYGVQQRLADWRQVKLSQPAQVMLTALVIVADWIASSAELFPYYPGAAGRTGAERLAAAWRGIDLPAPWAPEEPIGTAAELFASRFALPPGAGIRPVQEAAVRMAREMAAPGLMVIEAPMGEGKTEAALAVAEIFAARSGAGGCFVALPTRATGNAMFSRVISWLRGMPGSEQHSVFLAHAKAALNDQYAYLSQLGARTIAAVDLDGETGVSAPSRKNTRKDSAELVAHQWLRGRKKGMLASFAVGTVDQLLFAGLKSRHLALRHLALAGKVVVIDEIHAYDAYMSVYLERVLSWLGGYRVPVVMLSATLPADRRRALIEAYAGESEGTAAVLGGSGYPLVTTVAPGTEPMTARPPAASERHTDVRIEPLDDELSVLTDRLADCLSEGGCALVVRNTVDRVLQTAERLRERFGAESVTVAHSRFLDADRACKDDELLARFGPGGSRPNGPHIVVASQVAEQSLDIDFDLLVTDLAPVDLVLQRMGRLHRHHRGGPEQHDRPRKVRIPRCFVTGVDWNTVPPEPVRGSAAVYGRYTLLRALAVLRPHLDGHPVSLPADIERLVQRAYGAAPEGPAEWADAMAEAHRDQEVRFGDQRARAAVFRLDKIRRPGRSLVGWIDAGTGEADDTPTGRAQVRDSEESLEVLVVQRHSDGSFTTVPWLEKGLGGLPLPTDAVPPSRAARAVAASALRLPYHFSKPWMVDRVIQELEELCFPAWQEKDCPWLAGELILALDEDCRTQLAGYELHYSSTDGLTVTPAGARDVRLVSGVPSFDLVSRPWLPVVRSDGTTAELSLHQVFAQAAGVRRLVGDVPTQEFALLRLLLAILHDAVEGPEDLDDWEDLWSDPDSMAVVSAYLERHRGRFDLLDEKAPFFQVSGLRTEKDEAASLNRIVADVPNGDPFFTMRMPEAGRIGFAEAARWVVHAQAFDTSGIKSGAVGDPRVKGGKGYPQGVAWAGNLGGVYAEGRNLRETLLLNLVAADTTGIQWERELDRPAWRQEQRGPAASDEVELKRRPAGPRDLYTWQSRRLRLVHDGDDVHGVVLGYGDPLAQRNMQHLEPMTGWRRSTAQEKKTGQAQVYMPQEHQPARAAWRGLESLLHSEGEPGAARRTGPPSAIRPGIVKWVARLATEELLPRRSLIRVRTVGAHYGTQQSVIDEMVDDGVAMAVVLLHEHDFRYGKEAVGAVADTEKSVNALGSLAAELAQACGALPDAPREAARDLGFGELDGPYRQWLSRLGDTGDPEQARADWQHTVHRVLSRLARGLLDASGRAGWTGRNVETPQGPRWLDDTLADLRFRSRINQALPKRRTGAGVASPDNDERAPV
ncbi:MULTISPECIES: type I-E CRISPR-associated protein Cse1/CasA [unclassified Streptomyces]|uniref:type I-E CRISPR-associated protein Cse1/CasA n=1 Tax=unclassified Streptomyces TaxID=2593676 RepID=UPI002E2A387A|nr:type I-E CRISPR-associated protein Cse1/CasA [Streptomyces sp. NBC_00223]